jgi:hypothetical protein
VVERAERVREREREREREGEKVEDSSATVQPNRSL